MSVRVRPSVLRFLLDNLGWMLGSLALAALVWYAAVSAQNPVEERRFSERVPITWKTDQGLLLLNKSTQSVQVTIRALQSVWNQIDRDEISIVADLVGRGPDTYTVELRGSLVGIQGATIVQIDPPRAIVELARREEKRVEVQVRPIQNPPVGYEIAGLSPDQSNVLISGPEARVAEVQSVQARVNLQNRRASFTVSVSLVAVDGEEKAVSDVTISPTDVIVTVDIQLGANDAELSVAPRFIGELPAGYIRSNYSWEPRRIVVRGDRGLIESLGGTIPTDPIDLTGRTQTFTQTVKLALPPGIVLPDPKDISVTVEIKPITDSKEFVGIPVQPQGLDPADFSISIKPERVNVIVTGPKVIIDTLAAKDISVYAPLDGLSAGTHIVRLSASVTKPELTTESLTLPDDQVEVVISARDPTPTPTPGPTRTPTPTPTITPAPGG